MPDALTLDQMRADLFAEVDGTYDDPIAWLQTHRKIKDRYHHNALRYISFDGYAFMVEIIRAIVTPRSKTIIVKGRQGGFSEALISAGHYLALRQPNTSVIHSLNDYRQMTDFSRLKLNAIYSDTPEIKAMLGTGKSMSDTITMKQFKNNSAYVLVFLKIDKSAKSQSYIGIQGDAIFIDEYAKAPWDAIDNLVACGDASPIKIIVKNGTPTIRWNRMHREYLEMSDQRNWHVECTACGRIQALMDFGDWTTWQSHIRKRAGPGLGGGVYFYACDGCGAELDRARGSWVAHNPDCVLQRGYFAPQVIFPWVAADDLMYQFETMTGYARTEFIRDKLGVPYSGEDVPVREEWLRDAMDPSYSFGDVLDPEGVFYFGHDWGNVSYSGLAQFYHGHLYVVDMWRMENPNRNEHTKEIERRLKDMGSFVAVLDSGDGKAPNQQLMQTFPGKLWACFYGSGEGVPLISWDTARGKGATDTNWHVTVNHAHMVEELCSTFERGLWRFPARTERDRARCEDIFKVIMQVEREVNDLDSRVQVKYKTTPAHYFMTCVYMYCAYLRGGSTHQGRVDTEPTTKDMDHIEGFKPDNDAGNIYSGRDVWRDGGDTSDLWK